ncbi:hypothetical protein C2E21_0843 [Chlorella sorokiniana]|uniref:Uncharacterized protein n=1 Tax=Chlorella sorokiniana TaxID=3076 RepID=A0A2P6U2S2_CHLSO|nr:hypothetical protein C2E21_0843 [Chlorella sorokiniana]|eukprot:PRW60602.1 hypothetical protein C2E21_0843 [Chlorella sorokiniana]
MKLAAALLLALVGCAAARELMAPSPTEKINAQKAEQDRAAAAAAAAKAQQAAQQAAKRLKPPCFVPTSYYPIRSCGISTDAAVCGRGFNAFPSYDICCARQRGNIGFHPEGCTNLNATLTCWVAGTYHPTQTCQQTNDFAICNRNWGQWRTEADCCRPGAAHSDGCSKPEPCWIADAFWPARTCGKTEDQAICTRGWGAFTSEDDCCAAGGAFSDGCGQVEGVAE